MSTSVNTEESSVNMDEGVALPEDFRGNASSIGHPLGGGTPGKFNIEWGLIRGFERLTYPGGGGNEGGLFSKSLAPRGKQGTLQTKQVNFKLS